MCVVSHRHCCLQRACGVCGGDRGLHHVPHPEPVPADHLAAPGAAGRHAGPECRADPRSGLRSREDPRGDLGHHWTRCVGHRGSARTAQVHLLPLPFTCSGEEEAQAHLWPSKPWGLRGRWAASGATPAAPGTLPYGPPSRPLIPPAPGAACSASSGPSGGPNVPAVAPPWAQGHQCCSAPPWTALTGAGRSEDPAACPSLACPCVCCALWARLLWR